MSSDRLMRIHSAGFQAMAERVLRVTELTSRLNVLPFEDEAGKAELFEQILGRPLSTRVTIYPPFYTDHGLHLDLAERVFIRIAAWKPGRLGPGGNAAPSPRCSSCVMGG
ncbi:hypothetical protein [Micromonospora sp. NPDC005173]|uniref:hypothetical protein n=1 Tax=Micromonospora sp. NPDC005173 TaxID=3157165 RepID=UPI0033A2FAE6